MEHSYPVQSRCKTVGDNDCSVYGLLQSSKQLPFIRIHKRLESAEERSFTLPREPVICET